MLDTTQPLTYTNYMPYIAGLIGLAATTTTVAVLLSLAYHILKALRNPQ